MSFSKARYIDVPEGEDFIPGALNRVISAGISVNPPAGVGSGAFGSFRVRHFGPRSLIEDDSVRSKATTILNGEAGYKFSERIRLVLEGFNLPMPRCRTSTTTSRRGSRTSRRQWRTSTSTPRSRARSAWRCRCPSSRWSLVFV